MSSPGAAPVCTLREQVLANGSSPGKTTSQRPLEGGERVLSEALELRGDADRSVAALTARAVLARIALEQNDFGDADSLYGAVLAP